MRKMKEIQIIAKGRGRLMKATEYPGLSQILEYAFGDYDTHVCSGGGLESHPRLTDGTMYRTADNHTTMKRCKEVIVITCTKRVFYKSKLMLQLYHEL